MNQNLVVFASSDNGGEDSMRIQSVYQSVDPILSVLRAESTCLTHEVQLLLCIFNEAFPGGIPKYSFTSRKKPFVVFEGLDGSGKSTVSRDVAKVLQGITKATPPKSISILRNQFDKHPSYVRRAFYSLGNYIAAQEIQCICQEKPVFLDRYWHSTAAYALAQEVDSGKLPALPPIGDPIYKWPEDLLKPDLVIFLEVDENVRSARHACRAQTTEEENELAKNNVFRSLVLDAYKRMNDPPFVYIDSNVHITKTVKDCVDQISLLSATSEFQLM